MKTRFVLLGLALAMPPTVQGQRLTLGANFKLSGFLTYLWQFYLPPLSFMAPAPGPHYGYHELIVGEFLGGRFGSLEIGFSPWAYALVQFVSILMIAGLVAAFIAYRRALAQIWDVVLLLASIVASQMLLLHVVSYRSLEGPWLQYH